MFTREDLILMDKCIHDALVTLKAQEQDAMSKFGTDGGFAKPIMDTYALQRKVHKALEVSK